MPHPLLVEGDGISIITTPLPFRVLFLIFLVEPRAAIDVLKDFLFFNYFLDVLKSRFAAMDEALLFFGMTAFGSDRAFGIPPSSREITSDFVFNFWRRRNMRGPPVTSCICLKPDVSEGLLRIDLGDFVHFLLFFFEHIVAMTIVSEG